MAVEWFLLACAWGAALLTIGFLVRGTLSAAHQGEDGGKLLTERGRLQELQGEKRALFKAIKEIEFDEQTGKISPEDAREMSHLYRGRALAVMRAIEAYQAEDRSTQVERDVEAQLEVAGIRSQTSAPTSGEAQK